MPGLDKRELDEEDDLVEGSWEEDDWEDDDSDW